MRAHAPPPSQLPRLRSCGRDPRDGPRGEDRASGARARIHGARAWPRDPGPLRRVRVVTSGLFVPIVAALTFLSTMIGGLVALRTTTHIGIVIALGAGVRIGAAFFDLAPESARELGSVDAAMLWAGIGFLAFYVL